MTTKPGLVVQTGFFIAGILQLTLKTDAYQALGAVIRQDLSL